MCKKVNLDELIQESTLIKIGDACPFCKDKPYMNTKENDIVKHIVEEHKPDFAKILGKVEEE